MCHTSLYIDSLFGAFTTRIVADMFIMRREKVPYRRKDNESRKLSSLPQHLGTIMQNK